MRNTRLCLGLLLISGILISIAGCSLITPAQKITKASLDTMKPNPRGYRDTTEESEDEWSLETVSGHSMRASEHDPDPLKDVLMSNKARSIERSLGVE